MPLGGCYLHRNSECKAYNFQTWVKRPLSNLTDEKDADFSFSVIAYMFRWQPAYNVSIQCNSQGINGFNMILEEIEGTYSSCRIFDFRNLQKPFKVPLLLYYDCFERLNENNKLFYLLTVRSLPDNKQLVYQMNVPNISSNEIDCKSETLVMVLVNALLHNKIVIKFQKLPSKLSIKQYEVKLVQLNPQGFSETKILSTNPAEDKEMISVSFENIDRGKCDLSIVPLKDGGKCTPTHILLYISRELPNYAYIGWLVGAILLVVLISLVLYRVITKKIDSILEKSMKKIMIAYHPDNERHVTVVRHIVKCFENLIPAYIFVGLKLVNEMDTDWIRKSYQAADIIMIILSNGALTNVIDMPDPPYSSLFESMCNHISEEILTTESRHKTFIKVYFGNYDPSKTPELLKGAKLGPEFKLMRDFEKVFCRIKGVSSFWGFLFRLKESKETSELSSAIDTLIREN